MQNNVQKIVAISLQFVTKYIAIPFYPTIPFSNLFLQFCYETIIYYLVRYSQIKSYQIRGVHNETVYIFTEW